MNKKLLISVLVVASMALAGCSTSTPVDSLKTEQNASSEARETVVVSQETGDVEVPKNPKNIVVLELGILDALESLEVEVVGVPLSGSLPAYLSSFEDETKYTNVGSLKELNMEKIFELEPELIIIGGRQASYYEELSKIAPTVNLAVDNANYLESFTTNMTYLGQIFGKEAEVEAKLAELTTAVESLGTVATEKDANGLVVLANGDTFSVYGAGSRFGIIHNEFGITPVDETIEVSTHGQNASFEYIAEQNPDYLFVVDRSAVVAGSGSAPTLFDNPIINAMDAAKNGRITYLDPNVWYTSGGGFTSTMTMVEEITNALSK